MEIDKHLLFNFFEGKATLFQRVQIEKWLQEEANRELYFQWTEEWENQHPELIPNAETAYQKSLVRIHQFEAGGGRAPGPETLGPRGGNPFRKTYTWWIAASVGLVLAALAALWVARDRILLVAHRTEYGEVKTLILPDGSQVVMNANSTLRVPRFGFGTRDREVLLTGEARFSVQHTRSNQRFIVRTPQQLRVEVLGTEFVVFSRKRGSKVVLNKGRVRLWSPGAGKAKPLSIVPGDVVTINPAGGLQVQHRQEVKPHQAWVEKRFVFVNTSLREITAILKENFAITLLLPDSAVANRTLGGTFKTTKPENLLHSLAELLDLQLVALDSSTYQLRPARPVPPADQ
ncbi:MAG TPA: FecR domain-containing protein [Cytophagales bacterium]